MNKQVLNLPMAAKAALPFGVAFMVDAQEVVGKVSETPATELKSIVTKNGKSDGAPSS